MRLSVYRSAKMLSWLHGSAHQSQKHDRGHGIEFGPEIKVQGMACKRKTPDCWSMSFPPLLISCRVCFPMPYTPSIHVSEIATIKPGSKLFPMHVFDRSRTRPAGSISMQRSSMFESGSIDKLSMYKCKSEILTVLLVSFSS